MKKLLFVITISALFSVPALAAKDVTTEPEVYFLNESQSLDSFALLPPPPAPDSIEFLNDKALYEAGKFLRNTHAITPVKWQITAKSVHQIGHNYHLLLRDPFPINRIAIFHRNQIAKRRVNQPIEQFLPNMMRIIHYFFRCRHHSPLADF